MGGTMRPEVLRNEHLLRFIQLHPTDTFFFSLELEMGAYGNVWVLFRGKAEICTNVIYCISFKVDESWEYCREKSHHACN